MRQPVSFKDISGQRFGRLVVARRAENSNGGSARWLCKCDCGGETVTLGACLRRSRNPTRSCGCLARERVSIANTGRDRSTHGMTFTPIYRKWDSMIRRCHNENHPQYKNYGWRGIGVCEAWLNSFEQFFADVGLPPAPGYSLDRIDNDGNYEPGNVRWATHIEQQNKKTNNHIVVLGGDKMTLAQAIRASDLTTPISTIRTRVSRGWSIEEALT